MPPQDLPCPTPPDDLIDRICDEFEAEWQTGREPKIKLFLRAVAGADSPAGSWSRRALLCELIMIDLDYRWRCTAQRDATLPGVPGRAGRAPSRPDRLRLTLADYLGAFPELGPVDKLPASLIAEEYRVRRRSGEPLQADEYVRAYPGYDKRLAGALREIDVELREDQTLGAIAETAYFLESGGATPSNVGQLAAATPGSLQKHSFGRYRVLGLLGQGGFGAVYAGYDPELQRNVAIKVPSADLFTSEPAVAVFLREARRVAQLDHPGIVPVYDVGYETGRCYVVFKLLEGCSLRARLGQGSMPHANVARLVAEVAESLDYAHQRHIYHRDIKPANILLDRAERACVADFGLALAEDELAAQRGRLAGTPAYMAPELLRGEGHLIDGRADIYSLGVVLYEMLCGRCPFQGRAMREITEQVLRREARPPRQFDASIPAELERICLKALAKPVSDRYATARDMATELRDFVSRHETRPPPSEQMVLVAAAIAEAATVKARIGVTAHRQLAAERDEVLSQLVARCSGATPLTVSDTMAVARFPSSSAAVKACLLLQDRMARGVPGREPIGVSIGIHAGEVLRRERPGVAAEVMGMAVDLVERVVNLALPGQILMTQAIFNDARLYIHDHPARTEASVLELRWIAHGPYLIHGFEDPVEVFEVGVVDVAPLREPRDSPIARRVVPHGEEVLLGAAGGWRPASGVNVPGRSHWILNAKLGEGGFGEVWLGEHSKTGDKRVFKFCLQADRLRGLKREVAVCRLLKDTLGNRDDIAQVFDWQFEHAPFYLESEYTPAGSLLDWLEKQGGVSGVPLAVRLELVAQIADALDAAHGAGVLHKDIKPANVLVRLDKSATPHAMLADFGIGLVTSRSLLAERGITFTGGTIAAGTRRSSDSGTRLYMAPEILEGKAGSTLSDIYSLGVLLYQLAAGDVRRALAIGWERDVPDELLRQDIARCVDGRPDLRFQRSQELAESLRRLNQRRAGAPNTPALGTPPPREATGVPAGPTDSHGTAAAQDSAAARYIYFARFTSAERAWQQGHRQRVASLLAEAAHGEAHALRGFEWFHLWRQGQCHRLTFSGHTGAILAVAVCPNGCVTAVDHEGMVRVTDCDTAEEVCSYRLSNGLSSAAVSVDGRLLVTSADNGTVCLCDLRTGNCHWTQKIHEAPVWGTAIDRNVRLVLTGDSRGIVKLSSAAAGAALLECAGDAPVWSVAFSPDSERFATADEMGRVRIWDVRTMSPLCSIQAHHEPASSVVFSSDGGRLASASGDGTVRIWHASSGQPMSVLRGTADALLQVAFSSDDRRLAAVGKDGTLHIWELGSNSQFRLSSSNTPLPSVAFHGDNQRIVTGALSGVVTVWNPMHRSMALAHRDMVWSLAYSQCGSRLASLSRDGVLRIWHTADGQMGSAIDLGVDWKATVVFAPDGSLVAAPTSGGVRLWHCESGDQHRDPLWHNTLVRCVAFAPNGAWVVAGDNAGGVTIWCTKTGKELHSFEAHRGTIWSITVSPDSSKIATASADGFVRLWKTTSGKEWGTLRAHSGSVYDVCFTADGERLASAGRDGRIVLWDAINQTEIRQFRGHYSNVFGVAFDPTGARLASASGDSTVKIWDTEIGHELLTLDRHNGPVNCVAFHPAGTHIASGGEDGVVHIWDGTPVDDSTAPAASTFESAPVVARTLNLVHRTWSRLAPDLQEALALAYEQARQEGKSRISTRTFFAALCRLRPGPLAQLLDLLPQGSLPDPVGADVPAGNRILDEAPLLSTCVENAINHLLVPHEQKLGATDVFVDVAKFGTGPSVARLREYGVLPETVDRLIKQVGARVIRRGS